MPAATTQGAPEPDGSASAPRAALYTMGCRLNHAETAMLTSSLREAGYAVVPWGEAADLLVLNSCTVTGVADAKGRQWLRSVRRRHPQAHVAVVGCYAQTDGDALAAAGLADVVVGNGRKLALADILMEQQAEQQMERQAAPPGSSAAAVPPLVLRESIPRTAFTLDHFAAPDAGTRGHLKVQDGCDFMCSFCIIPVARGRSRARTLDNLLAEAEALAASGVQELVLTGVNLGTYAHAGHTLTDVVDALDAVPGVARLRISSIEPTTVDPGLLERMADPAHRLVPFLHLPLQSGAASVLRAMRRRYAPEAYRAFAEQALGRVPDLCLGTDVLVGFPGETDADFAETRALLAELPVAYAHVFPYSPRPGTRATRLAGQVPAAVRNGRATEVRQLSDSLRRRFHEGQVGRLLPVLFERGRAAAQAVGLTPNYIRVQVPHAEPAALAGRILPVRLLEAGTHVVAGALLSEDDLASEGLASRNLASRNLASGALPPTQGEQP
jgi:threonylcarbamoyladenosine tRNA methylthiotransferase MtaB